VEGGLANDGGGFEEGRGFTNAQSVSLPLINPSAAGIDIGGTFMYWLFVPAEMA
jgi:hypothetical protein